MKILKLEDEEIGALIAALNYTKNRTQGKTWWAIDEELLRRLKVLQSIPNQVIA